MLWGHYTTEILEPSCTSGLARMLLCGESLSTAPCIAASLMAYSLVSHRDPILDVSLRPARGGDWSAPSSVTQKGMSGVMRDFTTTRLVTCPDNQMLPVHIGSNGRFPRIEIKKMWRIIAQPQMPRWRIYCCKDGTHTLVAGKH